MIQPKGGGPAFASQYTPAETVVYENLVKVSAQDQGITMIECGPVELRIDAYWPMRGQPLKTRKRQRERKVSKPDLDNLVKIVSDALNGIAFHDDSQVAVLSCTKWHAGQGEEVGVRVVVRPLSLEPYDIAEDE